MLNPSASLAFEALCSLVTETFSSLSCRRGCGHLCFHLCRSLVPEGALLCKAGLCRLLNVSLALDSLPPIIIISVSLSHCPNSHLRAGRG